MFDYDKWQEIFYTIRKNKLRTILTMFGVFWGIFMLFILMGSGNALRNGVLGGFKGWATNAGYVWPQKTSMAYKGYKEFRNFGFKEQDLYAIREQVEGVEFIVGRLQINDGTNSTSYKNKSGAFTIHGDFPEYIYIQIMDVFNGRYINDLDIKKERKVAVIGKNVEDVLFEGKDPIGEYINVKGIPFKVVGVFKSTRTNDGSERDEQVIYIPFTTFQKSFNMNGKLGWFGLTAKSDVSSSKVMEDVVNVLKERHAIHPDDKKAIGNFNLEEQFGKVQGLFAGISGFIWFVGLGTIMAGVIGVSNIMLIIIKERIKEIGVRKSLGATPGKIISLIMQESVFITVLAGYSGLILGLGLIELASYLMTKFEFEAGMFKNPQINPDMAIMSFVVLVFCGCLAGIIPAIKASRISPIEALRVE